MLYFDCLALVSLPVWVQHGTLNSVDIGACCHLLMYSICILFKHFQYGSSLNAGKYKGPDFALWRWLFLFAANALKSSGPLGAGYVVSHNVCVVLTKSYYNSGTLCQISIRIMCYPAAWSKHLAPFTHHPRVWLQSPLCQRREARSAMESSQRNFLSFCTPKLEWQVGNKKHGSIVGYVMKVKSWISDENGFKF